MSEYVAVGRVDLEAVVDGVAEGSIASAADLEAKLAVDTVASVDLDADGRRDELRVVERREEKRTVFEVRAVPAGKAKAAATADAELEVAAAPLIAELELEAKADAGEAVFRASYAASFVASAKLDAAASVERTFTGVGLSAEGHMIVDAGANAFVSWSFEATRPRYVAAVFVVEHRAAAEPDPCWPPGHCKHGFWKATGEPKPGHQAKEDRGEKGEHGRDGDKAGKHDGDHDASDKADKGKAKPTDKAKPANAKAKPASDKPDKPKGKSGGDKGKGGEPKAGKGK